LRRKNKMNNIDKQHKNCDCKISKKHLLIIHVEHIYKCLECNFESEDVSEKQTIRLTPGDEINITFEKCKENEVGVLKNYKEECNG